MQSSVLAERVDDVDVATEAEPPALWSGVIALTMGVFALVTSEFLPASVLTPLAADLGVSVGAAGQAVTATAVVGAFAAPLTPVLTGRFDRRLVMLGLMVVLAVSNLLTIFAANLPVLLVARVLLGAALGGFWSMAAALGMRLVPKAAIPKAMSLIFTGVSIATVSAAPVGAYVSDTLGWRAAFVIAGIVGLAALAAQALTLPRLAPTSVPRLGGLVEVARRPAVAAALVGVLLVISGHFAGFTYVRPVLEQVSGLDVAAISLSLLAFGVAGFFGNLAGGALVGRDPRLSILGGAGLIAVAATAIVALGSIGWVAALALSLWGFAFAMLPVGFQAWATSAATDQAELAGGLLTSTFQVAIALGAVLGGLLVDRLGPLSAPGYAVTAALAGVILVLAVRRGEARRQPETACQACG
ncbi:MFS transporter [Caulobacter radicis]|uniref:MFS transporter n=1 Tax=Caulobacter radicis TaxID=2172650 RepID=A0A2T9J813_9CAUL|nr:MFS transporter [Caulobacter radicis]PVM77639.1 MFS transporter [Caulobacter radicis]